MTRRKPMLAATPTQISLFGIGDTPDAFRKAVQVIHSKPKSPLSLLQRKLGNAWLKNAVEKAPDSSGWWELGIQALEEDIGFDSNNRQYLKEAAEALMRVVFEWDVIAPANKRVMWKASVLFPEVELRSDVFRYQISSQMRELMMNPEIYAMIDMNIVRRFRRAPSLAIWEFCIRFEKIGLTAEVPWEDFRDMVLGESGESKTCKTYQEYKFFKSKILNPSVAEINAASNHVVALVESKVGRRVTTVRFSIQRKALAEDEVNDDRMLEIISDLVKFGVPASEAKKFSKTYRFEAIKGALEYTRKRLGDKNLPKLENPPAYFRQALVNQYAGVKEEPKDQDTSKPDATKPIDIKAAFLVEQSRRAEDYFNELDTHDQEFMIVRYNDYQPSSILLLRKKATKAAKVAFFEWLAKETWGEPTAESLLAYAQEIISQPHISE